MLLHKWPEPFAILQRGEIVSPIYKTGAGAWQMHERTLIREYVVHTLESNPKYLGLGIGGVTRRSNGLVWPMAVFADVITQQTLGTPTMTYDVIGFVFDPKCLINVSVLAV